MSRSDKSPHHHAPSQRSPQARSYRKWIIAVATLIVLPIVNPVTANWINARVQASNKENVEISRVLQLMDFINQAIPAAATAYVEENDPNVAWAEGQHPVSYAETAL